MRQNGISALLTITLLCPMMASLVGCQTTVGGQTLPSPWYLKDDVQYFPAGPEFKLSNQVRALEEYKLEREKLRAGIEDEGQ
jgi:hypothetical protein